MIAVKMVKLLLKQRSLSSIACICFTSGLFCFLMLSFWIGVLDSDCKCDCIHNGGQSFSALPSERGHQLAVIIPLRDRFEELQELVLNLTQFLNNQRVNHHIFAISQVDGLRFNRGSLLNIGFLETPSAFDYIALHDVDLLPNNPEVHYKYPNTGPLHLAAPHLHPRYHYPTFIGGVMLITREDFKLVNGLSNRYWGWGLEDDEFYVRLTEASFTISRPGNLSTGYSTFRHLHDPIFRRRDQIKCYDQHLLTRRRDRRTGLDTVQYEVLSRRRVSVENIPFTVVNVALHCNKSDTPWCDCRETRNNSPKSKRGEILAEIPNHDLIAPKIIYKQHISPDG